MGANTSNMYNFDVSEAGRPCLKSQPLCGSDEVGARAVHGESERRQLLPTVATALSDSHSDGSLHQRDAKPDSMIVDER